MTSRLVKCDVHGMSPAYMVCRHVLEGAPVTFKQDAREDYIGQQVCADCEKRTDLTADDGEIVCAGCMAGQAQHPKG